MLLIVDNGILRVKSLVFDYNISANNRSKLDILTKADSGSIYYDAAAKRMIYGRTFVHHTCKSQIH